MIGGKLWVGVKEKGRHIVYSLVVGGWSAHISWQNDGDRLDRHSYWVATVQEGKTVQYSSSDYYGFELKKDLRSLKKWCEERIEERRKKL
jgi:hypothetical protein